MHVLKQNTRPRNLVSFQMSLGFRFIQSRVDTQPGKVETIAGLELS